MLDFHCHILPNMDDGSKSIEESLQMLEELERQGVTKLVLSSHFYPSEEDIDEYLDRRDASYKALKKAYKGNIELLIGSEVHYYNSIANSSEIKRLCLENSDLLLLELPMFSKIDIANVVALNNKLQVVLAHFERYLNIYSKKEFATLIDRGVYLQSNCESFSDKPFQAIKDYFEQGSIRFIGTDCHNLSDRKPNYEQAVKFIEEKYSKEYLNDFLEETFVTLKERCK